MVCEAAHNTGITFTRHSTSRLSWSVASGIVVIAAVYSTTWLVISLAGAGVVAAPYQQMIVIDTDPGIDDAVAILTTLNDPDVNVIAITCVRGNSNVPNVVVNALKLLSIANKSKIPVYTGSDFGLVDSPKDDDYFGKDGLGDVEFSNPPSISSIQTEHAASFLAQAVKKYPGILTVLCLGPLTNLALAINLNPQFLLQVHRVVILGGSIRGDGNVKPGVEFNFYMDPDAASVVLSRASLSGTQVTLMPMETVKENDLTKNWRWNRLGKLNNSVITFLNKIETSQLSRHPSSTYTPYDAYAASVIFCPGFVTQSQKLYGFVENCSDRTKGALVIDYMNNTKNPANINVIMDVNTTAMKSRMYADLSKYV